MFNGYQSMNDEEELEEFVSSSQDCVELKFVKTQEDFFNDQLIFQPVYTHQVFENEKIFGYKDIKIKLYYTPDTLDTYLNISYHSKVDPSIHKGTKPDDVIKALLEWIPEGFISNEDHYISMISKPRRFKPLGELVHVFMKEEQNYEIYKVDFSVTGFKAYLQRLQTFVIWFIEAGSFVDFDDDNWSLYLMYRKDMSASAINSYDIIGYSSVYSYYAFPDKIRPRISQMLILPPYQRRGLGGQLLQCIYNDLLTNSNVLDITVEDPSPEFTSLRDFIDCRNCLKLPCYATPTSFPSLYTKEIEDICRQKLKLNKVQSRRVYEILKLRVTDKRNTTQYKDYRLFVKNRLNGAYKKQEKDIEKLKKLGLDQTELLAAVLPSEERMRLLHDEYQQIEEEYIAVIEKLAAD